MYDKKKKTITYFYCIFTSQNYNFEVYETEVHVLLKFM